VFDVGQGTQDLGFRSEVDILFRSAPAREVKLHVVDENGQPTTAMFIVRDRQERVYFPAFTANAWDWAALT